MAGYGRMRGSSMIVICERRGAKYKPKATSTSRQNGRVSALSTNHFTRSCLVSVVMMLVFRTADRTKPQPHAKGGYGSSDAYCSTGMYDFAVGSRIGRVVLPNQSHVKLGSP